MTSYHVRDSIFPHYTCQRTKKVYFAEGVYTVLCESQVEHRWPGAR